MRPARLRREQSPPGPAAACGRTRSESRAGSAAACILAVAATAALAGTSAAQFGGGLAASETRADAVGRAASGADGRPKPIADGGGGWLGAFLEGLFGLGPKSEPRRPSRPQARGRWREREPRPTAVQPAPQAGPGGPQADATYRTMCVRLCDGYYWPVSFATTVENFARDERSCVQSCSSTVALYYYPNPGGQPEEMVDLRGVPYKSLGTAFLHRTTYDPKCKCRPHPWEPEAAERHKGYAGPASPRAAAPRTAR